MRRVTDGDGNVIYDSEKTTPTPEIKRILDMDVPTFDKWWKQFGDPTRASYKWAEQFGPADVPALEAAKAKIGDAIAAIFKIPELDASGNPTGKMVDNPDVTIEQLQSNYPLTTKGQFIGEAISTLRAVEHALKIGARTPKELGKVEAAFGVGRDNGTLLGPLVEKARAKPASEPAAPAENPPVGEMWDSLRDDTRAAINNALELSRDPNVKAALVMDRMDRAMRMIDEQFPGANDAIVAYADRLMKGEEVIPSGEKVQGKEEALTAPKPTITPAAGAEPPAAAPTELWPEFTRPSPTTISSNEKLNNAMNTALATIPESTEGYAKTRATFIEDFKRWNREEITDNQLRHKLYSIGVNPREIATFLDVAREVKDGRDEMARRFISQWEKNEFGEEELRRGLRDLGFTDDAIGEITTEAALQKTLPFFPVGKPTIGKRQNMSAEGYELHKKAVERYNENLTAWIDAHPETAPIRFENKNGSVDVITKDPSGKWKRTHYSVASLDQYVLKESESTLHDSRFEAVAPIAEFARPITRMPPLQPKDIGFGSMTEANLRLKQGVQPMVIAGKAGWEHVMADPVTMPSLPGRELFAHFDGMNWRIYDGATGLPFPKAGSVESAIRRAEEVVKVRGADKIISDFKAVLAELPERPKPRPRPDWITPKLPMIEIDEWVRKMGFTKPIPASDLAPMIEKYKEIADSKRAQLELFRAMGDEDRADIANRIYHQAADALKYLDELGKPEHIHATPHSSERVASERCQKTASVDRSRTVQPDETRGINEPSRSAFVVHDGIQRRA